MSLTFEQKVALNLLELGVTENGTKVRYLGRKNTSQNSYLQCYYDEAGFINVVEVQEPYDGIVGLWKDRKISAKSIEWFLNGRPLKFRGSKCFIYYSHRDTELREYIVQEDKPNGRIWNVTEDELLEEASHWSDSNESESSKSSQGSTRVGSLDPQGSLESLEIPKPIRYLGMLDVFYAVDKVEDRWCYAEFEWRNFLDAELNVVFRNCIIFATEKEARTMCNILNGELKGHITVES